MGVEIERKFLIDETKLPTLKNGYAIKQGYIQTVDHITVRIRVRDKEAFLTIKGKSQGASRLEFEYPIPLDDAEEMLTNLCHASRVEKIRYLVEHERHTWEVDIFEGSNQGLIIAEIELQSEDEDFSLPEWVGEEVTHDKRYFNVNLVERPYTSW